MNKYLKGLSVAIGVSIVAYFLAKFILIGSVTIAIILGIILGNIIKFNENYNNGITYAEKTLLGYSIALMGINLDFHILTSLGFKTLFIIILGMIVTIYSAVIIGKYYKVDMKLALLLGIGNGVCGSSAISATAPVIKADKNFIGISVAIVNLLGTVGIFLVPFIALSVGLNEIDAGILVGNTLQAVGQVTAGGFSIGDTAGVSATTVKMGRILLLTPLVLILIYMFHSQNSDDTTKGAKIPGFIIVFILFSLVSSFSLVSEDIKHLIASTSHVLLLVAMSAVGLKIHFNSIKSDGKLALKIATIVFAIQIIFTLGLLFI
jgi:uncharacterized integral membrane protein (TIGR00698 family)